MIPILVEPSYANSIWCRKLIEGLVAELKLKRLAFQFIESVDTLDEDCKHIYIVGTSAEWVRAVLEASTRFGVYPILLCNEVFHEFGLSYSTVCSDTRGSMKHLVNMLRKAGRDRIALYGVNPNSVSDESRKRAYLSAMQLEDSADIFLNDGSLESCYADYRSRLQTYDAVICANDFAAISLVRNLLRDAPGELERFLVIGCAETWLTDYYSKYVLSIRINFLEYGRAAVMLLENLCRNSFLSHIVMAIRWDFNSLAAHQKLEGHSEAAHLLSAVPESEDTFYSDLELHNMLRVERLLNGCDSVDREVLQRLTVGEQYEVIAERCFVTVSTVKYRIKKMLSTSQTTSRSELVSLVQEYISTYLGEEVWEQSTR